MVFKAIRYNECKMRKNTTISEIELRNGNQRNEVPSKFSQKGQNEKVMGE